MVGHHRAGGEVGADADDVGGVDAGPAQGLRHGLPQHVDVVRGHLQRPVGRQDGPVGQGAVDDGVGVLVTALASSAPSRTRTTTARPDRVPKSTPTTKESAGGAEGVVNGRTFRWRRDAQRV